MYGWLIELSWKLQQTNAALINSSTCWKFNGQILYFEFAKDFKLQARECGIIDQL